MLNFILEKVFLIFADVFVEAVVRVFFGWNSKLERAFGVINIVAFFTVIYCLYRTYYVTAGLFFALMIIVLYFKLRTMAHIESNHQ